ncbi:hypothetical protein K435DRAFT_606152, partial [Dendrothele bispora CBS 962.96]
LGIFKRRFDLFTGIAEYPEKTQVKFVPAFAAIHNFIRINEPRDTTPPTYETGLDGYEHGQAVTRNISSGGGDLGEEISTQEQRRAKARRDAIAQKMWDDYLEYIK